MSQQVDPDPKKLSVGEFARQFSGQLVPLNSRFSYFFTALSLSDDDVKEYLRDPVRTLPPRLRARFPETSLVLVPYLERGEAAGASASGGDLICFERPEEKRAIQASRLLTPKAAVLVFGMKDQDTAEYHYRLFHALASVAADICEAEVLDQYTGVIRDELAAGLHGEVDEESWELKQALLRRQRNMRRKTKGLAKYARQSFIDTLTLYLHGICCDIDVETGPRQLASRHLRRRLELLQSLFPPPDGYVIFPEELSPAGNR